MKISKEFKKLYHGLNASQKEAVDTLEGPVMVIAGPGTGKTKILTLRIANILARTDTPPEAILALTFTESGAAEMKSRLAEIIGTDAYRVTVTTFHAYCNSVIQNYPESLGVLAGATSIPESDQAVMLQQLIDETKGIDLLRPVNAPDLYLKAIVSSINTLKREGVSPQRLHEIAQNETASIMAAEDLYHEKGVHKGKMKGAYQDALKQTTKLTELALVYAQYQGILRAQRLYDFNDMVMEVARVLESDENLRLVLQEQHQYLLVDEHQDTNNAQNRIIELLASFWERPNLFVVGDAKQAIYRFQGASLENFLYFKTLYPEVKLIELQENYRSSQHILDAAAGVRPAEGGALHARAGHADKPIEVITMSSPDAQYWSVAGHIQRRIQSGTRPEEIAVLARDNRDAVAVSEFLQKLSIPFTLSTQQDILADPYLHQLICILDALRAFGSPGPLLIALHAPVLGVDPLDLYKLSEFCRKGRNPYDVMRSTALMHEAGIDGGDHMRVVATLLTSWATAVQQPNAAETLETIVRQSGLLAAIVADVRAPETLGRLHELYAMLKSRIQRNRAITLAQFADHLEFLRTHGITLLSHSALALPGRVRVMTVHKSKGLEFDYVYIIDAVDGHWGSRRRRELISLPPAVFLKSVTTQQSPAVFDDEERNVFYVALTRARKHVVLALSHTDHDGSELMPTQFLSDIQPSLLAVTDTAELERAWIHESKVRYEGAPPQKPQGTDREYIGELFQRHGLSVTALNNYLLCPWKYFYTNLLRIPEAPAFALMYGNAVDKALEEYFNRFSAGTRGTRDDLVGLFEGFIRHQPLQQVELELALSRGRAVLTGYYDRHHMTWGIHGMINQLRIPAVELAERVLINGKIDKVELMSHSNEVTVVDYKTGKPKSRNQIIGAVKDGDGNYFRQLTFYKLLLDRWQDGKYRMSTGVIDFVEPDARGVYHQETFHITDTHVTDLEAEILRVAGEIRNLTFWNKRCDDRSCAYCPLRDLMEKR